jgi:rubredoxin
MTLDMLMWGSTYDDLTDDERRVLRASNIMEQTPLNPNHPGYQRLTADGGMAAAARGTIGDFRTVIAILLMLNRPSLTSYRNSLPNRPGIIKGKLAVYMAHTTVTIDIDPVPTLRLVGTPAGESVPRRRHEVRGHYAQNKEARDYARIAGCIHNFEPNHGPPKWLPWPDAGLDDPDNWVCSDCGGKRWWIPEHERGDASRGFVVHDDYEVIRRRQ